MFFKRSFALIPLRLALALGSFGSAAFAGEIATTCTNPASGASWQIKIDYDKSTVDSNPASIGTTQISWHDASDNSNYTLDRTSGALTVIRPSSTGGYELDHHCQMNH